MRCHPQLSSLALAPAEADLLHCLSLRDLVAARHLLTIAPHLAHNIRRQTSLLSRLARAGLLREALDLFRAMPTRNVVSHNALLSSLLHCGHFHHARNLFDGMLHRNSASWNALISAHAAQGQIAAARSLFDKMPACDRDVVSWTAMIAGHCRAGEIWEAYRLFDVMIPRRNVVTWTAMISGFAWNGFHMDALLLFKQMMTVNRTAEVSPNSETMVSVIYACSGIGFQRLGMQIHAYLTVRGMNSQDRDGRLAKGLIHMYSRFGLMGWAHWVFDLSPRDPVSWHSMIEGYIQIGRLDLARGLFDKITADCKDIAWITMIVTWTVMIKAYLDGEDVAEARKLFDLMAQRDATAWTALISGMVQNELIPESFDLFAEMRASRFAVMDHALATLIGAAGSIACLQIGAQLHGLMIKSRPETDTILCNALVSMYAKCGEITAACQLFNGMTSRDVISWNSLIMGLAHHGMADEALMLFDEMVTRGEVKPNRVTFLGVISACGHAGLLDRGLQMFDSMVEPGMEHYACVVDMLGRAGRFEEASRFVRAMPVEPGLEVWGALLGTCGIGGRGPGPRRPVGEWAAERVFDIDPFNGPAHVALCHVYAKEDSHVDEGELRREMGRKGVRKSPGCSWIAVKSTAHVFSCGDRKHPESDAIYDLLERLSG